MAPIREDYVRIFDTTLRDGEQSPGATMTSLEKLEVARGLARLGVDVMEAGFPAASPDDLAAVRAIAEEVGNNEVEVMGTKRVPIICGLARAIERDIEKAWKAVSPAKHPRIHTFLATSPIHREHKLRMSKDEVLKRIDEMVRLAVSFCPDVEFSPEDAGRTEEDFLWKTVEVAIAAGATTINIPDTVGYTTPNEFGAKIKNLIANVPGIDNAVVSVHCHNDLGMATANTLSAIQNGARQAEVTINGIGERAGNTALEEVVMALQTRKPIFGLETGIDSRQITRASRLVSSATGMSVQPNKAVVGANAFAHESGIHQDGMLKNEETYEIMRPESVGLTQTKLVLGKHSGRHAVKNRLQELGYALSDEDLGEVFEEFKRLADRKKHVTDADILALVASEVRQAPEVYALEGLQFSSGTSGMATATVRLRGPDGGLHTEASLGSGPVDACFKAIDSVVQEKAVLLEYAVHAVTEGIDALGEVTVRVRREEPGRGRANPQTDAAKPRVFHGHGADTDVLVASAKAYLSALNRMFASDGAAATFDSLAPQPPQATESSSTTQLAAGAGPQGK